LIVSRIQGGLNFKDGDGIEFWTLLRFFREAGKWNGVGIFGVVSQTFVRSSYLGMEVFAECRGMG
jgi:hypothetical protein|tara:strand:- start:511 stop:705 length:195 start_codon:yes stop_codon:yes gene_type:complete